MQDPENMTQSELVAEVRRLRNINLKMEQDNLARRFCVAVALALRAVPVEHHHPLCPASMAEYDRKLRLVRSQQGCRRDAIIL